MGLDMFASTRSTVPAQPIDFDRSEDIVQRELFYWRKHPNLHGWMQRLYVEKGGDPDPNAFNLVAVLLTSEDLDRLKQDVLDGNLPDTSGFFFGESGLERMGYDLEFISRAQLAIANGEHVFYHSWW